MNEINIQSQSVSMRLLSALVQARESVLLVGPPGIGKTARINQAAKLGGARLIVWRLSTSDRVDLSGAIVPDVASKTAVELPLALLAMLRATKDFIILLLDDIGQAPPDVQAAAMSLWETLPPNVVIWGATNRPQDKAAASGVISPLQSRFSCAYSVPVPPLAADQATRAHSVLVEIGETHLHSWEVESAGWCSWAIDTGIYAPIVAWHRDTAGRHLYQFQPSSNPAVRPLDYRTWAAVSRRMVTGNLELMSRQSVAGVIGNGPALAFLSYCELLRELPLIKDILANPDSTALPKDKGGLMYLVSAMLASVCTPKNVSSVTKYAVRLPRVYTALICRDVFRRHGSALAADKTWGDWFNKNSNLFDSSI